MECSPMESISIEHISMWHDLRHPNQARWMAKGSFRASLRPPLHEPDTGSSRKVMATDWSSKRPKTTQCVRFGITPRYLGHAAACSQPHVRFATSDIHGG
jgi:hypothetical protein